MPEAAFRSGNAVCMQQTLRAWRPILTPRLVILLFVLVGLVFVPFGAVVVGVSDVDVWSAAVSVVKDAGSSSMNFQW